MSFRELEFKKMYRTKKCNIVEEFFTPVLNEATEYKRAVGFFSSSALYEIAEGIIGLVKNNGRIKLIVSPRLSAEDVVAIKEGYDRRKVISNCIERDFKEPIEEIEKNRLNLLANLISENYLDIKVAFMEDDELYHEKIGIVTDGDGNRIAFSGSMNETYNAFCKNFESIMVFDDWNGPDSRDRVHEIDSAFDLLWADEDETLNVIPFPKAVIDKIDKYKALPTETLIKIEHEYKKKIKREPFFRAPKEIEFYDYQEEAVNNWIENDGVGIFDMATGSGKTYTALYALSELSLKLNDNFACIIVVPYQHLVEQWVEDIEIFGVKPIVAYSSYKWREKFKHAVREFNSGRVRYNFCVITTISTFCLDDFQTILNRIKGDICFVADEAHNMGAENCVTLLPECAKYRLALSATIERFRDEKGTNLLYDYFGEICQSFTLKDAITRDFLTEYYYYPVIVSLEKDELDEYEKISKRLTKSGILDENMQNVSPAVKVLLVKRARIISGARNKVEALLCLMDKYKDSSHILVYCGATKYDLEGIDDDKEVRQIEYITKQLYERYNFSVRKFTSSENKDQRAEIKQMFTNGDLQIVTAIKCLDEGVNIPAIKTAFILASSTNPKEYIQRRGRVLRKAQGKDFAEIYDFITLPYDLGEERTHEITNSDITLVKKELDRMLEFADTSKNPIDSDEIREKILRAYGQYICRLE